MPLIFILVSNLIDRIAGNVDVLRTRYSLVHPGGQEQHLVSNA